MVRKSGFVGIKIHPGTLDLFRKSVEDIVDGNRSGRTMKKRVPDIEIRFDDPFHDRVHVRDAYLCESIRLQNVQEALQDLWTVVLVIMLEIMRTIDGIVLACCQRMQFACIADNIRRSLGIDIQQIMTPIAKVRRYWDLLATAAHVQEAWLDVGRAGHRRGGFPQVPQIAKQDHLRIKSKSFSRFEWRSVDNTC